MVRKKRIFRRHEIWWAGIPAAHAEDLEFSDGTKTEHPFLIVSTNTLTSQGLCIGVPGTSSSQADSQWHYTVTPPQVIAGSDSGLSVDTHFLFEQMRCISTRRLKRRAGRLHGIPRTDIEDILRKLLELPD